MSDKPRYSFGDVQGAMADSTHVEVLADGDAVSVSFTYRDARTGQWYRAAGTCYQEKIVPPEVAE